MNKIYSFLMLLCLAATTAWAQNEDLNTLQFVDADGNVVPNGTTLNFRGAIVDDFGMVTMATGLRVKNSTTDKVSCNIAYTVSRIDNGDFELCFPANCTTVSRTGNYNSTIGDIDASATIGTQSSWLPVEGNYGQCVVKMQLQIQKYNPVTKKYSVKAKGPVVTAMFDYNEQSSAISSLKSTPLSGTAYNLHGQPVTSTYKGIVIIGGKKVLKR